MPTIEELIAMYGPSVLSFAMCWVLALISKKGSTKLHDVCTKAQSFIVQNAEKTNKATSEQLVSLENLRSVLTENDEYIKALSKKVEKYTETTDANYQKIVEMQNNLANINQNLAELAAFVRKRDDV